MLDEKPSTVLRIVGGFSFFGQRDAFVDIGVVETDRTLSVCEIEEKILLFLVIHVSLA